MNILVLNAGSSTQKSSLYAITDPFPSTPPEPLWAATVDWNYEPGVAQLEVQTATGITVQVQHPVGSRLEVIQSVLATLWQGSTAVLTAPADIHAVGHRVVHGGLDYSEPVRVTETVKAAIARLSALAPAHNPVNLEGIVAAEAILGLEIPQFAVFDTAFHRHLPEVAALYPGPYHWAERGIRRYGFHGISHEYCAHRTAQLLQQPLSELKLIICHLGNGCSLSAVAQGACIDTTMGFTPLEGLMMGSRCGSVDPGLLIHLLRQEGYTVDQLDQELNQASGLKGISGVSSDMRQVMAAIADHNPRAQLALDMYIYRLRAAIGSMLASLGQLDALVFTAGVGENSARVRSLACQGFEFLGLTLDETKNEARPVDQNIAHPDSRVPIFVIHTQEDWAITKAIAGCIPLTL